MDTTLRSATWKEASHVAIPDHSQALARSLLGSKRLSGGLIALRLPWGAWLGCGLQVGPSCVSPTFPCPPPKLGLLGLKCPVPGNRNRVAP